MTRTLRAGRRVPARRLAVAGLLLWLAMAGAEQIDTGIPDLKIRWDNTIKYSAAFRTEGRDSRLTGAANYDDGDRNFGRGLISNRVDLLSEFDLSYQGYGFRVSGADWYDTVYNRSTDNDSAGAVNSLNSSGRFNNDTRRLHGRQVELLDAFVFGKTDIDDTTLSGRAGRHALVWGESLFFGENGIAGGQSPIDVVKALSVPNTPFKELIRPVNQVSGQWQVAPALSFGAYYQLEWRKTRLPGAGSYFSTSDNLDVGGERILAGAAPFPGAATPAFYRAGDLKARDGGQGGIQVKFQLPGGDTDFGVYATRFHAKDPNVYLYRQATIRRPGRSAATVWSITRASSPSAAASASRSATSIWRAKFPTATTRRSPACRRSSPAPTPTTATTRCTPSVAPRTPRSRSSTRCRRTSLPRNPRWSARSPGTPALL